MSYPAAAIRTAVRQVLEGASGSVRTLPGSVFRAGVHEGKRAQAKAAKLMHSCDHRFDVQLGRMRNHPSTPVAANGPTRVVILDVTIDVYTRTKSVVRDEARDEVLALIASDLERAAQALHYPNNLATTAAPEATYTRIVGGLLFGPGADGSPELTPVSSDWDAMTIRSRIAASAILDLTQATA